VRIPSPGDSAAESGFPGVSLEGPSRRAFLVRGYTVATASEESGKILGHRRSGFRSTEPFGVLWGTPHRLVDLVLSQLS
jgi:hypothetical protein